MNTQLKIVTNEINENPIRQLKEINEQINFLTKMKKEITETLTAICDAEKSDEIMLGDYKAVRKLVVSSRLDTKAAKTLLGDKAPMVESESIRWTIV